MARLILVCRWFAVGLLSNAHARGPTPNLAYQTAHSDILVDRSDIYSFLSTRVILQNQEQRYDHISHC